MFALVGRTVGAGLGNRIGGLELERLTHVIGDRGGGMRREGRKEGAAGRCLDSISPTLGTSRKKNERTLTRTARMLRLDKELK